MLLEKEVLDDHLYRLIYSWYLPDNQSRMFALLDTFGKKDVKLAKNIILRRIPVTYVELERISPLIAYIFLEVYNTPALMEERNLREVSNG